MYPTPAPGGDPGLIEATRNSATAFSLAHKRLKPITAQTTFSREESHSTVACRNAVCSTTAWLQSPDGWAGCGVSC